MENKTGQHLLVDVNALVEKTLSFATEVEKLKWKLAEAEKKLDLLQNRVLAEKFNKFSTYGEVKGFFDKEVKEMVNSGIPMRKIVKYSKENFKEGE